MAEMEMGHENQPLVELSALLGYTHHGQQDRHDTTAMRCDDDDDDGEDDHHHRGVNVECRKRARGNMHRSEYEVMRGGWVSG